MAASLKPEPDLLDAAEAQLAQGRPNDALETASRALLQRDDADARALFVECVGRANRVPTVPF